MGEAAALIFGIKSKFCGLQYRVRLPVVHQSQYSISDPISVTENQYLEKSIQILQIHTVKEKIELFSLKKKSLLENEPVAIFTYLLQLAVQILKGLQYDNPE